MITQTLIREGSDVGGRERRHQGREREIRVWLTLRRNGRIFIDDLMRGIKMFGG